MKKIGLFLLAVVMVAGLAGCSDDNNQAERVVYATQNTDGTTSPPMSAPAPAPPPPESAPPESQEITIAKCLTSKGAVLYGADWCPYTQNQIASFKDGFQFLSYVECTEQLTVCRENGISAYPTWVIGGSRIQGYRAPTVIGSAAGCTW